MSKVLMEIEQLKKDKEFNRNKQTMEVLIDFQQKIKEFNTKVLMKIADTKIELREKIVGLMLDESRNCDSLNRRSLKGFSITI